MDMLNPVPRGRGRGKGRDWLPQEVRRLRQLNDQGYRSCQIAGMMGRTECSVAQKKTALGIRLALPEPRPKEKKPDGRVKELWTKWQDDRLRLLWNQGVVTKVIAQELGKSFHATLHRRERLGLQPRARNRRVEIKVRVEDELSRKAHRRAAEKALSLSNYVRSLILRDVG